MSLEDRVPKPHRVIGRARDLAAALARVAGAGDQAANAENVDVLAERERLDLDAQAVEGLGALDGEERPLVRDVFGLRERSVIRLGVGGVDDEQIVARAAAVGDQVVDDSPVVVGEQGVLRLPCIDAVEIVRQAGLEVLVGAVACDAQLAHVRDVEDSGPCADGAVLLGDARILHRHLPSGEGDEARTECGVALVEWRPPERLHRVEILPVRRRFAGGCRAAPRGSAGHGTGLERAYERRKNEGTSSTSEGTSKPSPAGSRSTSSDGSRRSRL